MQYSGCLTRWHVRPALERKCTQEISSARIVGLKCRQHDDIWAYCCSRRGRVSLFYTLDFSGTHPVVQYFGWVDKYGFPVFLSLWSGENSMPCKDPERDQLGICEERRHFQQNCFWKHKLPTGQLDRWVGDRAGTLSCCLDCQSSSHVAAKFLLCLMTQ